jgi:hypothetical protein
MKFEITVSHHFLVHRKIYDRIHHLISVRLAIKQQTLKKLFAKATLICTSFESNLQVLSRQIDTMKQILTI